MWMLLEMENGEIVPSHYAKAAKDAGLNIITWTLERGSPLTDGSGEDGGSRGFYFQTLNGRNPNPADPGGAIINNDDGAMYPVLHVLAQDVGILGIFSDWPATVTYYANCMHLE